MSFKEIFDQYNWDEIAASIYSKTATDVECALEKAGAATPEDFMALVSPAAGKFLEQMAQLSHQLTRKRFGKVIQMYIPLYLSNECRNICTYCGFSLTNNIDRVTLNEGQLLDEVEVI